MNIKDTDGPQIIMMMLQCGIITESDLMAATESLMLSCVKKMGTSNEEKERLARMIMEASWEYANFRGTNRFSKEECVEPAIKMVLDEFNLRDALESLPQQPPNMEELLRRSGEDPNAPSKTDKILDEEYFDEETV